MLGLIFLKYISNTFTARRDELTRRFADKNDDYFLPDGDAAMLTQEVRSEETWTPAVLDERQKRLVGLLKLHWGLAAQDASVATEQPNNNK